MNELLTQFIKSKRIESNFHSLNLLHRYSNERPFGQSLLDFNDTHVLDFRPSLKTLAMQTVLRHNLDYSPLPRDIK